MNNPNIKHIRAFEILDSRGRPTIEAHIELTNGIIATAQVPSGASTGLTEAHELRDNAPGRHKGLGVTQAVHNINSEIAQTLSGHPLRDQFTIDQAMICLLYTSPSPRD